MIRHTMYHQLLRSACCALVLLVATTHSVWADVAPPAQPPGSSIDPGTQTQVRMVSERVVLDVQPIDPMEEAPSLAGDVTRARVHADFQMRNLGTQVEQLQVRFPLGDPGGFGNGFGAFPQVQDFAAAVNSNAVATTIITSTNPQGADDPPIQWAAFDVAFPQGEDVPINVTYTITPTGYLPKARFAYVLETGAGWRDTIGVADIVVRLPYAPTTENVFSGEGETSPGGQFVGNEIRWHRENLEPTAQDNIVVSVLVPKVWQAISASRAAVAAHPDDPAALLGLSNAYEAAVTSRYPREEHDRYAALSETTLAQAVALQPESATLHATYAALVFEHMAVMATLPPDDPDVVRVLREVQAALALDPQNQQARTVYDQLQQSVEGGSLPLAPTPITLPTVVATVVATVITPAAEPTLAATVVAPAATPVALTAIPSLQPSVTPSAISAPIVTPTIAAARAENGASGPPWSLIGVLAGALIVIVGAVAFARRR